MPDVLDVCELTRTGSGSAVDAKLFEEFLSSALRLAIDPAAKPVERFSTTSAPRSTQTTVRVLGVLEWSRRSFTGASRVGYGSPLPSRSAASVDV
jgi:hypothetical protein